MNIQLVILVIQALFMVDLIECNFYYFSLSKELYIPGRNWSAVNVSHQLNKLTPYVYDLNAQFILSQSTQYNQTNSVFDFFLSKNQFQNFNSCYQTAVTHMNTLYQQYQPCQQKCQVPEDMKKLGLSQLQIQIGDDSTQAQDLYYIIDNTFYPCTKGIFQPQLYLFEQLSLSIQTNSTFYILLAIACVALLQILIMLITYIMIMFNKLHQKKSKLLKLRQEKDNKDVLKNFISSKNNY